MDVRGMRNRAFGVAERSAEIRSIFADGEYHKIEPTLIELLAMDVLRLLDERAQTAPVLDALRVADPQTLPEHIAKLVADWKAL
jgi:hypothetical protein